jgi:DNA-binding MarR family transcriptional regulator
MTLSLDDRRLSAWRTFLNTHAALTDVLERELATERRLPLSSYDVLVALQQAPGQRMRLHELADAVVLSRSGLTRLVDRLAREGLLCREHCPTDGRGAFAVLTEEGREVVRRAWPIYAQGIEKHFGSVLDDTELEVIAGSLARVLAAARNQSGSRPAANGSVAATSETEPIRAAPSLQSLELLWRTP